MSYGLQVWNDSGILIFNSTDLGSIVLQEDKNLAGSATTGTTLSTNKNVYENFADVPGLVNTDIVMVKPSTNCTISAFHIGARVYLASNIPGVSISYKVFKLVDTLTFTQQDYGLEVYREDGSTLAFSSSIPPSNLRGVLQSLYASFTEAGIWAMAACKFYKRVVENPDGGRISTVKSYRTSLEFNGNTVKLVPMNYSTLYEDNASPAYGSDQSINAILLSNLG